MVDGYDGVTGNYKIAVGTLPEIIGSDIASDDSYLDIYFSEGMYTEATTSGALVSSDFEVTLNPNGVLQLELILTIFPILLEDLWKEGKTPFVL